MQGRKGEIIQGVDLPLNNDVVVCWIMSILQGVLFGHDLEFNSNTIRSCPFCRGCFLDMIWNLTQTQFARVHFSGG